MAGLIKKQILKILTKFTDGLQPDDIQALDTNGEAELKNLALNPTALQDLLNLPTWLKINSAKVNGVSLKIQWMQLQKHPIRISFDHVSLEAEALTEPRAPNGPSPVQDLSGNSSGPASYGFIEGIFEGIRIEINGVSVTFGSTAFTATLQIQQILIFSAKNNWSVAHDLRESRIKGEKEVATRKKIQWASVRIEATWKDAAPVRLITNQGEVRIQLRRRIIDCAVLANRVEVLLDDLLWILTDRQIQAALLCVKSLTDSIDASRRQNMSLQRSNSEMSIMSDINVAAQPISQLVESSSHFSINRLDLHICEESADASAVQLTLHQLAFDYYPARKAARSRKDFNPYTDAMMARDKWIETILQDFREDFKKLREKAKPTDKITKLKENCLIFRLLDLELYQVSSPTRQNTTGLKLISSARSTLHLPDSTPFLHFETTDYFTPDGRDYPMPHNNVYIQLNALLLNFDSDTVLWLHRLVTEASGVVQEALADLGMDETNSKPDHQDIHIDILMPKIIVDSLTIQTSQISVTNRLQINHLTSLDNVLDIYKFISSSYGLSDELLSPFTSLLTRSKDPVDIYLSQVSHPELCRSAVTRSAHDDVGCVNVVGFWIETRDSSNKLQTIIKPTNVDIYLHQKQIIAQLGSISATLTHDQYIQILQTALDMTALGDAIAKASGGGADKAEDVEIPVVPNVDILGKDVEIEFLLVPFSSSSSIDDPLQSMPIRDKSGPFDLPPSSLKLKLLPILARVHPEKGVEIRSRLHLRSRNYQQSDDQISPLPVYNLNGASVMKVVQDPSLTVTIEDEVIKLTVENETISIQNSVVADLAPFFEAPFPPDPKGGPDVNIVVKNVTVKLLPDMPTMYPNSFAADLFLTLEEIVIRLNPDGSISILQSHPPLVNGTIAAEKQVQRPQPPPRPSMLTRTAIIQTDRSCMLDINEEYSEDALCELQERNMSLQREREALREALERMQEELLQSETRCEMFRSQLQAMKQLLEHQSRK